MKSLRISVGANTLEKVSAAVKADADSVFAGLYGFTLEADTQSFSENELEAILKYAHENNVKVYCTIDRFLHNSEIKDLDEKLYNIKDLCFDAFIVADIGLVETIRKYYPKTPLHLSAFANCVNSLSVLEFAKLGFDTIIPGHESSLEEIAKMASLCPLINFEIPVHGQMCISYSGRTLISSHLGPGVHSNAYELAIEEDKRRGLYCPVDQKDGFLTIYSSKELCMAEYINEIKEAGIEEIRIQTGKNGPGYISNAVNLYKNAIKTDGFAQKTENPENLHSTHFCTGFYFKNGPVDTF